MLKLISPNFNHGFQQQQQAPNKGILFDNKFPPVGMEDLFKNIILYLYYIYISWNKVLH